MSQYTVAELRAKWDEAIYCASDVAVYCGDEAIYCGDEGIY